jgi:hypothetical protein
MWQVCGHAKGRGPCRALVCQRLSKLAAHGKSAKEEGGAIAFPGAGGPFVEALSDSDESSPATLSLAWQSRRCRQCFPIHGERRRAGCCARCRSYCRLSPSTGWLWSSPSWLSAIDQAASRLCLTSTFSSPRSFSPGHSDARKDARALHNPVDVQMMRNRRASPA